MGRELEAKFWVTQLSELHARVLAGSGRLRSPRRLEHNERFDSADGRMPLDGPAVPTQPPEVRVLAECLGDVPRRVDPLRVPRPQHLRRHLRMVIARTPHFYRLTKTDRSSRYMAERTTHTR